jgi:hypothetical protein
MFDKKELQFEEDKTFEQIGVAVFWQRPVSVLAEYRLF